MPSCPGNLFIISAPSGAGKTSLVNALVPALTDIRVSVSHTTRAQRPGEVDGVNYHLVSAAAFAGTTPQGGTLESAEEYSNRHANLQRRAGKPIAAGTDVILEIDWQGAQQVRKLLPQAISVFILPPSRAALEQRLNLRGQDPADVIAQRMAQAIGEMEHYAEADYLLVNDQFDIALAELR